MSNFETFSGLAFPSQEDTVNGGLGLFEQCKDKESAAKTNISNSCAFSLVFTLELVSSLDKTI